jgi:hypothetical protein
LSSCTFTFAAEEQIVIHQSFCCLVKKIKTSPITICELGNDAPWKKSSVTETGSFWKVKWEAVAISKTAYLSEGAAAAVLTGAGWRDVPSAPECTALLRAKRLKRIFELAHFRKYGNRIQTEIRILRFEGCLKLFTIPA